MDAPTVNNLLPRLQRWYVSQCDGDWEHSWGIKIATLDNPGWTLTVNLEGTDLEERAFAKVAHQLGKGHAHQDWMTCYVEGKEFKAAGGPGKLAEMIAVFLTWAERAG